MTRPADCPQSIWQAQFQTHSLIPFDGSNNNGSLVYYDFNDPKFWWHNPTNYHSLRLTKKAFGILIKTFSVPKFKVKLATVVKPKTLVQLERHFRNPYYIQTLTIMWVFDEADASILALHDGDLQQYLDNHE